jgi:membrane associated rhomboid family serine protease
LEKSESMSNNRGGNFLTMLPPVTRVVLILNVVIYILDFLTQYRLRMFFSLYTPDTHLFKPYQLVTHMFLHGSFFHIFFNMFTLYMFGRILESVIGSKKFFILYFTSGLGAAGLQLLAFSLQHTATMMLGASGAIFGVIAAFAVMFPNVELMFIFLPVPIKAKYLIPIIAVLTLFMGIANFSWDNIAQFAHLGGAIVGFILIMFWKKNQFKIY